MSTVKLLRTFTQTTGDEIEHIVPEGTWGVVIYQHEDSEDVVVDFLLSEDEWREVWNVPLSILKVIDKRCTVCDGEGYIDNPTLYEGDINSSYHELPLCSNCNGWCVVEEPE